MSQRLFSHNHAGCQPIASWQPQDERQVQRFFESNMNTLLDLHFLASEWAPGVENLRVDSISIDRQGSPVIIEFKKTADATVVAQALCYREALLRNKAEFENLCKGRLNTNPSSINWGAVKIICLAPSFSPFDLGALSAISAEIELISYQFFGDNNVLIESVASNKAPKKPTPMTGVKRTFAQQLVVANPSVKALLAELRAKCDEIEDVYTTEGSEGLSLSTHSSNLATITLTQGLHPRLRIRFNSLPSQTTAAKIEHLKKGRSGAEVTLRESGQIPHLIEWLETENKMAMMAI